MIRLARKGRVMFAWIAICFGITAMGLGEHHGCGAMEKGAASLAHHHSGPAEQTPSTPAAPCDCVGHACGHASMVAPTPGIAIAFALETVVSRPHPGAHVTHAVAARLLPYATAPPRTATA
jgi:hypothetical protein